MPSAVKTEVVSFRTPPVIPDHQLVRCVGQGAYGDVWLGKTVLGTFRALKVVYRRTFSDARPYEREFAGMKEFEPVSRTHPGLVSILHIGRNEELGYFYYVMELGDDWAAGQTIDPAKYAPKTLRTEISARGRLPARECLPLSLSVLGALGHLHKHGLVHRDLKPSNVIFIGGAPKLADVGLVTSIGEAVTPVGTEGYMPPEGPGTPAGDLYSFGKLLYELSTGLDRSRFPSLPTQLHEFEDAPLIASLNKIILKACDPKPSRRFRSADELEKALRKLTPDGGTRAAILTPTAGDPPKSVAVLPFLNMSAERENEYLSDGITEDLTTTLAQVKGLRVAGRTSAFAFRGKAKDIRKIAEQLGVRTVLEGSVRKFGDQLRITAQLVNAADGCCLWSERFDRQMKDVFALQDEISRAIVAALKVRLAPEKERTLAKRQTASTQAYQLYLQGRFYWNLRGPSLKKALHYFELALLEDPQYALAYAGIADSFNLLAFYGYLSPKEAFTRAKTAALKAVELDETLAEAHNSLGFSDLMYDTDGPAATKEFYRALEINPHYIPARYWLASYLSAAGRHEEAIQADLHALEIDPLSPFLRAHLGWTYLLARKYDHAIRELMATFKLDASFVIVHWALGRGYAAQGHIDRAIAAYEKLLDAPPFDTWGIAWLGYTYALLGHPEKAEQALRQLEAIAQQRYVRIYWFALLNLGLGRLDVCFQWLQRCVEDRDVWVGWIRCDPSFDAVQTDPRFLQIRKSTGFE
jgi:TolB-like protein/Flp pilus assembly protein TadD